MKKAIYPGSFDPVTYGHIDIIERASDIFDELIVAVLNNKAKTPLFSVDERVNILNEVLSGLPNVKILSYEGLLVDFAVSVGAGVIVRGLRAVTDFEYELQLAQTNSVLNGGVDTIFLTTSLKYAYLSSSTVKEVASYGGNISKFVPPYVEKLTYEKFGI
ncbi:MAG: pantetheine-phosphate adenylyltransferase [Lachnospiraceae bacterium]|jgi:pantetheine-phosphate adenylyltransferase|nr:pantetheine-phosphate adenylyltransferase [Lachnospiraceae bacterium]MBQ8667120.1 pantetheine-phosphate adenylyltransferase [Lachnospiraceae bacterium]